MKLPHDMKGYRADDRTSTKALIAIFMICFVVAVLSILDNHDKKQAQELICSTEE